MDKYDIIKYSNQIINLSNELLKDENEKLSRTNRQLAKYSVFDGYKLSETEKQNNFKLIKSIQ